MDVEQEMYDKYARLAPKMWDEDRCVFNVKDTDEHHVDIMPLIFTFAVVLTPKDDPLAYVDRWCYHSFDAALVAAVDWDASRWMTATEASEPQGWHRHPMSGRRRDHGKAEEEYIAP